jgi:hypothetical protein
LNEATEVKMAWVSGWVRKTQNLYWGTGSWVNLAGYADDKIFTGQLVAR